MKPLLATAALALLAATPASAARVTLAEESGWTVTYDAADEPEVRCMALSKAEGFSTALFADTTNSIFAIQVDGATFDPRKDTYVTVSGFTFPAGPSDDGHFLMTTFEGKPDAARAFVEQGEAEAGILKFETGTIMGWFEAPSRRIAEALLACTNSTGL